MVHRKPRYLAIAAVIAVAIIAIVIFMYSEEVPPSVQSDTKLDPVLPHPKDDILYPTHPILVNASSHNSKLKQCLSQDGDYKYFCAALVSGNISFCSLSIENDNRLHCLAYVGKTPVLCDNTTNRGWCYHDIAINMNKIELCEKSDQPPLCRAIVGGDVQECGSLGDSEDCIWKMAALEHDASVCDNAKDRASCINAMDE